jgi:hypothetical protein
MPSRWRRSRFAAARLRSWIGTRSLPSSSRRSKAQRIASSPLQRRRSKSNTARSFASQTGKILARPGVKGHCVALARGENAEAVVLDFVNPAGAPAPSWQAGQVRFYALQLALQLTRRGRRAGQGRTLLGIAPTIFTDRSREGRIPRVRCARPPSLVASHGLPNFGPWEHLQGLECRNTHILLATPAGFEPATFSLEGCCSIP